LTDPDLREACIRITKTLGKDFIERIERKIGQEFEESLELNPKLVMSAILDELYTRYVMPFEMILEISEYLFGNYDIRKFGFAFSEYDTFIASKYLDEIREFINDFYIMIEALDFTEKFRRIKDGGWG